MHVTIFICSVYVNVMWGVEDKWRCEEVTLEMGVGECGEVTIPGKPLTYAYVRGEKIENKTDKSCDKQRYGRWSPHQLILVLN